MADRNQKGQFAKGNKCSSIPLKPGEVREPHPTIPYRDSKGRLFANQGGQMSVQRALKRIPPGIIYQELHALLLENANGRDIQSVYTALFGLTQGKNCDTKIQLEAIKIYLNRFFGAPQQDLNITQTTQTKVNLDLTSLSDEELQTYLNLQTKVQSNLQIENKSEDEEKIIGENGEAYI